MVRLSTYFTVEEFQRVSDRVLTSGDVIHASDLAWRLDIIRQALGVPLIVTSYIRKGSQGQHGDGTAVDVEPQGGPSQRELFDRVSALTTIRPFGQLIFYPFSDEHVHLSLPTGTRRNEVLIANADETEYEMPTPTLIASLPGSTVAGIVMLGVVLGGLWMTRGRPL